MGTEPNAEFGQKVFDNLMSTFLLPEMRRRQGEGLLPDPLPLRAAQVIFHPDGRPNEVRFNGEVKCLALAKKSVPTRAFDKGDTIYEADITGFESMELTDSDDPDCAHATVLLLNGQWHVYFDFRYNKGLARRHVESARQFLAAARLAWQNDLCAPCLDNLYSAAELAARAELLTAHDVGFRKGAQHGVIRQRLIASARLGNLPAPFTESFDKLMKIRYPMRYLRGSSTITDNEVSELIQAVEDMIALADERTAVPSKRGRNRDTTLAESTRNPPALS